MASRRSPRKSPPPAPAPIPTPRDHSWLLFVVIAIATLAAYQPAWRGGLLWDDDAHLTPPVLASGPGLVRIWTDFTVTQQYYPIVSTAFWVMNQLWGHDPFGYHVVNILLHALSAFLVAAILRRWSVPGAAIAAVMFALHPVHVESVAWMTELKNTLSGVFYLLAAMAYLRFDRARDRLSYALALVAFVFALGTKTVTATLPAALIIVLWWRRGRVDWRRDVLPLLPFFAVGAAAGVGTAWLEYVWVGAKGDSFALTFVERGLLAGRAVWFYAGKLVWPMGLVFTYPRWPIDQSVWWQYLFPIALLAAIGGLWAIRGRTRAPLAAALYFCATLFPALGFVNVFPFRYSFVADHFQYLASLGIIALLASGLAMAAARWRPGWPEAAIAVAVGAPLFVLTFQQSRQYVSAETLYRTTIAANPSSALARNNLSALLLDGPAAGWSEAGEQAREAVRIHPGDAEAHNNLGVALERAGHFEESAAEHREAIRLNPELPAPYYNLGIALADAGKLDEAVAAYEASLRILPAQPQALHNLGKVLTRQGRLGEAVEHLRAAARLAPDFENIQMSLGNTLQVIGSLDEAIAAYKAALRIRPEWGEVHYNLAMVLQRVGRVDEAAAAFGEADRLMPGSAIVQEKYAALLVSMHRLEQAVPHFERALAATTDPPHAAALHNDLGIVLAMVGRIDAAIPHFEAAIRLRPDLTAARDNLARARRGK